MSGQNTYRELERRVRELELSIKAMQRGDDGYVDQKTHAAGMQSVKSDIKELMDFKNKVVAYFTAIVVVVTIASEAVSTYWQARSRANDKPAIERQHRPPVHDTIPHMQPQSGTRADKTQLYTIQQLHRWGGR